ncbi:NAD-binding protein [Acinetobacter haemolyticus]|uniref:NAD(P)-dependent oxidoreductase n=1 Tax=Acinetobacter haemolyticus TaxID=29430 RepID=UPI000E594B0A|nr:NAD(P)-dependent oxidoreductase [Acinetobacter haemolyticus]NAR55782.1 NAD-binding protein [Acinetobacter haemolyticus]NAR79337.1 NAD-binding protein [Acinetobacter haemolyticus]QDJ92378.1 NAD(P)-dependent oxidoreductase [Acinetobacter haemolyticus]
MSQSVAFIGLGAMGYRMAAHLPKHFDTVLVWNRNFIKAEQHATEYGTTAVELSEAVQADIIFSCLPTSQDVETLIDSVEIKSGAIWIDCTSGVPEAAQRLAEKLKLRNIDFLDAPVSGQTIGAENATLTFMVGGDVNAFERAYPAMAALGKLIQHVGDSGAGFAVKAINNMLLAVNLWSVAEGFSTLKAHGVNLDAALNCINASSGKSLVTENIFPQRVLSREFPVTFALPLLAKDTGIALDLVHDAKLPAPILSLTQSLIQAASLTAEPNSDFSAAVKMYESWSKITLE